jgi:PAS domain S-box-containing protein
MGGEERPVAFSGSMQNRKGVRAGAGVEPAVAANRRPLRVLLIEDNPDDASLLLRELRRVGYEPDSRRVDVLKHLQDALDSSWDLILCDCQMPGLDAPMAVAAIRGRHIDTPCIIVSGTVGEEHAVAAMRSGAQDFILKSNLSRLGPAIERELRDSEIRIRHAKAQSALRATEQSFRAAFELIPDAVLLHQDGFVTHTNSSAASLFGAPNAEDLIGRAVVEFFTPTDQPRAFERMRPVEFTGAAERAKAAARPFSELTMVRLDGKLIQVEMTGMSFVFEDQPAILSVLRDVTGRREMFARSMHVDRMLAVGTMAAGVGHEINNPLGYVMANVTYASGEVARIAREVEALGGRLPQAVPLAPALNEVVSILSEVDEGTRRIRDIARDLNTFARNDDELQLVDLRAVADSALRMAAAEVRPRALVIREYADVPPVRANASRVSQVLLNLVINAAHAIGKGATFANKITVRVRSDDGVVVVEVTDTGSGIAPEHRERLFTPFFTTKPLGQGTGLGLSISKRIIESFQGRIEVDSEVGVGTTMRVVLPAVEDPQTSSAPLSMSPPRRGRIMLIDDDRLVRAAFQRALSGEHDVVLVGSASEALSRLRVGEAFDVVICDMTAPSMPPDEIYSKIEQALPHLTSRIVMITGGEPSKRPRAVVDNRAIPTLEKPLDMDQVRQLLARMLPGKGPRSPGLSAMKRD